MTLLEALELGVTKVRLPEWDKGQWLEVELEETERGPRLGAIGMLYTPGDKIRRRRYNEKGKLISNVVVPSEKRKIDTGSYRWADRYEAYEDAPATEPIEHRKRSKLDN